MTEDTWTGLDHIEANKQHQMRLFAMRENWEKKKSVPKQSVPKQSIAEEEKKNSDGLIYHSVALSRAEWDRFKNSLCIGWEVVKMETGTVPITVAAVYLRKPYKETDICR